jgi:hypothetical protein
MIGRPAGDHDARAPDRTVIGYLGPHAGIIQVFVADGFARHVAGGNAACLTPVAVHAPLVESVETGRRQQFLGDIVQARQPRAFGSADGEGPTSAADFRFTAARRDDRHVTIAVRFDAVVTGTHQRNRDVRGVHFEALVFAQIPDADVDGALGKTELRDAVIEVENGERRAGVHADGGRTHVQFGLRAGVRPQVVTCGHGVIDRGGRPLFDAAGAE